ncbi:hypothetical protein GN958_ATG18434 [Phytophthora infestans]|uniref:Uncharacterized protein n=1 Tax=Phytophthora infestans TaxID=4787 RepID=A0A8S9TZ66_PHYIN|nr:hypothetical protein GN958_ATG18434 [Phytophthora infestans]
MKTIREDCWNGGDSGDTRDIKPLAYQQETPRPAASVQSEKPSQTTVGGHRRWRWCRHLWCIETFSASCPSG